MTRYPFLMAFLVFYKNNIEVTYSSYSTFICTISFDIHKSRHYSTWIRVKNLEYLSCFQLCLCQSAFSCPTIDNRGLGKVMVMRGGKKTHSIYYAFLEVCFYLWFWFSHFAFCLDIKSWVAPRAVVHLRMTSALKNFATYFSLGLIKF